MMQCYTYPMVFIVVYWSKNWGKNKNTACPKSHFNYYDHYHVLSDGSPIFIIFLTSRRNLRLKILPIVIFSVTNNINGSDCDYGPHKSPEKIDLWLCILHKCLKICDRSTTIIWFVGCVWLLNASNGSDYCLWSRNLKNKKKLVMLKLTYYAL